MKTFIKVLAVITLLSAFYGIIQQFFGSLDAKTAVQQIAYAVYAIMYAIVPYYITKTFQLFDDK